MLAKENKINTQLFKDVLNKGKFYNFTFFSTKFLRLTEESESKFAFVAPKKAFRKAVLRNLIRRKSYNIIKNARKNIIPSTAVIFFFKKEASDLDFSDLEKEIIFSLKKMKLLKFTK